MFKGLTIMKRKKKSKIIIPKLNTFRRLNKNAPLEKGIRIGKIIPIQRMQRYLRPILNLIKISVLHKRLVLLIIKYNVYKKTY